jgi:hypothetical protein
MKMGDLRTAATQKWVGSIVVTRLFVTNEFLAYVNIS